MGKFKNIHFIPVIPQTLLLLFIVALNDRLSYPYIRGCSPSSDHHLFVTSRLSIISLNSQEHAPTQHECLWMPLYET